MHPISMVNGAGPVIAEKLAEMGITTAEKLLATPVETIAAIPRVGLLRATKLMDAASDLIGPEARADEPKAEKPGKKNSKNKKDKAKSKNGKKSKSKGAKDKKAKAKSKRNDKKKDRSKKKDGGKKKKRKKK